MQNNIVLGKESGENTGEREENLSLKEKASPEKGEVNGVRFRGKKTRGRG